MKDSNKQTGYLISSYQYDVNGDVLPLSRSLFPRAAHTLEGAVFEYKQYKKYPWQICYAYKAEFIISDPVQLINERFTSGYSCIITNILSDKELKFDQKEFEYQYETKYLQEEIKKHQSLIKDSQLRTSDFEKSLQSCTDKLLKLNNEIIQ